jgi:hypothetical protein
MKICDYQYCTHELIGSGEFSVTLIRLGPLICLIPMGMEHGGECSNDRSNGTVSNMICGPYLILYVDMELLQVCRPLLMEVVLQFPLCLYEMKRLLISVDDCLLSQKVMFPLATILHNGLHFLVIGGVFQDSI